MHKILFISFLSFLVISNTALLQGQTSPSMTSTTQPSSTIQERKLLEKPQSKSTPSQALTPPPKLMVPPPQIAQRAEYLHPGILVFMNGKWEGSDHLLNLQDHIGVYVSILKPEDEMLDISPEQLQNEVEAIFKQSNIQPVTLVTQGRPPLPAFEIEIFLYPIEKGYAACCDGRLFESVVLERFKMDPNMAFQAITWEKQMLIVGPKSTFADQLTKTVQTVATSFVERYQAYERIKSQIR